MSELNAAEWRAKMSANVAEACADALLSACALGLGPSATFESSRAYAIQFLDLVLARTEREGAKPE